MMTSDWIDMISCYLISRVMSDRIDLISCDKVRVQGSGSKGPEPKARVKGAERGPRGRVQETWIQEAWVQEAWGQRAGSKGWGPRVLG